MTQDLAALEAEERETRAHLQRELKELGRKAPEFPEAPGPEATEAPEPAEALQPEATEAPEPKTPEAPEAPAEATEAPETPEATEAPGLQLALQAPEGGQAPEKPAAVTFKATKLGKWQKKLWEEVQKLPESEQKTSILALVQQGPERKVAEYNKESRCSYRPPGSGNNNPVGGFKAKARDLEVVAVKGLPKRRGKRKTPFAKPAPKAKAEVKEEVEEVDQALSQGW